MLAWWRAIEAQVHSPGSNLPAPSVNVVPDEAPFAFGYFVEMEEQSRSAMSQNDLTIDFASFAVGRFGND
jgi:hypothetical protein